MRHRVAHHQGMRILALVVSLIVLAPNVLTSYNITRNDNVRFTLLDLDRTSGTHSFLQLAVYVFVSHCST